jgi:hypothetical protein
MWVGKGLKEDQLNIKFGKIIRKLLGEFFRKFRYFGEDGEEKIIF